MKAKLMTKLALAAAVAVAATVGQASDLKLLWEVAFPTTGNWSTSAYFFLASDDGSAFSDMKTTTISDVIKVYNAATDKSSTEIFDTATYIKPQTITTYGNYYSAYKSVDSSASESSILAASFFALITDPDNDRYMIATTSEGKQTITPTWNNSASRYEWNWGTQTASSWLANGTVPEPTSGVLLLVGVAALALRRKNAA